MYRGGYLLKLSQKFIRLSSGGYIPVDEPKSGYDTYIWDDQKRKIVLLEKKTATHPSEL